MKEGDLVKVVLTGEIGMLLEVFVSPAEGFVTGYLVRLPDYSIVKFFNFEIDKR